MSDNEARARENQRKRANTILLDVFDGDQSSFSAADVAIVAAALDEAELRGKREGLSEAKSYAEHLVEAWRGIETHEQIMRLDADVGADTAAQLVSVIAALLAEIDAERGS